MFDLVGGPVSLPPRVEKVAVGDRRGPHQLGSGGVILGVGQGPRQIGDDGPHRGLAEAVRELHVPLVGEVPFHHVSQHVDGAGPRLFRREREGQLRVEQGETGSEEGVAEALLVEPPFVGDDRNGAGLASCGGKGEDHADGKGLAGFGPAFEKVPEGPVGGHAEGDGLGRVDDAAAADGQNEVHPFPAAEGDALLDEGEPRIGLDTSQLNDVDAGLSQACDDAVEKAAPLDAPSAVVEEHLTCQGGRLGADGLLGTSSENDLGGVLKGKITHGGNLLEQGSLKVVESGYVEGEIELFRPFDADESPFALTVRPKGGRGVALVVGPRQRGL